jgi:hypothetical protein
MTNTIQAENTMEVGMKLWLVLDHIKRDEGRECAVTKIGRKWIWINENRRIQIGSNVVEAPNYGRVGLVYKSREQWQAHSAEEKDRNQILIKLKVDWSSPIKKLPLSALKQIEDLLEANA